MNAWKIGAAGTVLAFTCGVGALAADAGPAARSGGGTVSPVTAVSQVCMVNDHFMGVEQIPVQVEGRTYYGCCPMCKTRLAQDKSARQAVDPVSGKTVDKATAVIGRRADGSVLYFESKTTLERYNGQAPPAQATPQ